VQAEKSYETGIGEISIRGRKVGYFAVSQPAIHLPFVETSLGTGCVIASGGGRRLLGWQVKTRCKRSEVFYRLTIHVFPARKVHTPAT
jgi:hypothetical protein